MTPLSPLRSKAIIAVSAFMPGNREQSRVGQARRLAPKITAAASRAEAGFKPVTQRRHARASACLRRRRSRRAETGDAATFSVPARGRAPGRRPGSAVGEWMRRGDQRTGALRAAELVRRKRHQVGAERVDVAIDTAGPLHRVDVQHAVGGMHDAAISAIGWITPVSLLASMTETSGRSAFASARCERREIDAPVAVDRQLFDCSRAKAAAAPAPTDARSPRRTAGRAAPCGRRLRARASAPACWLRCAPR